jgi:hypothetical protein
MLLNHLYSHQKKHKQGHPRDPAKTCRSLMLADNFQALCIGGPHLQQVLHHQPISLARSQQGAGSEESSRNHPKQTIHDRFRSFFAFLRHAPSDKGVNTERLAILSSVCHSISTKKCSVPARCATSCISLSESSMTYHERR